MPAKLFAFSQNEIRERFVDHWDLAERFAEAIAKEFNVKTCVNVRRLYITIISTYADIARYKNFHLDDPFGQKSDAVKRSAYLAKWICRFKPLQVIEDDIRENFNHLGFDKTVIINELFALHLAAIHLSVHIGKDFVISEEKAYEIAYEMMYRHLSEDSYMLVFQMICNHIKGTPKIVQVL